MKKIGFISPKGKPTMAIYYDEKVNANPYRVYLEWYDATDCGLKFRRKQDCRYADLYSCGIHMAAYTAAHNEEGR